MLEKNTTSDTTSVNVPKKNGTNDRANEKLDGLVHVPRSTHVHKVQDEFTNVYSKMDPDMVKGSLNPSQNSTSPLTDNPGKTVRNLSVNERGKGTSSFFYKGPVQSFVNELKRFKITSDRIILLF